MYNPLFRFFLQVSTFPAKLKGAKIPPNSYISPGYDFWGAKLSNLTLGKEVYIGKNSWINTIENGQISIGDGTHIGRNSTLHSKKSIKIGSKCLFSYNVSIIDHDHIFSKNTSPMDGHLSDGSAISVGNNCFVGAHSFILKGVTLGNNCVVGANSVVTKSFPSGSIIAGSPAKIIKK